MLTWSEIEEISKNNIEIGAHTVNHVNLTEKDQLEAKYEILGSKIEIETHLKKDVRFFSAPFGIYSYHALDIVSNSGFEASVGGLGTVHEGASLFPLRRIHVDKSTSLLQLNARLTRAFDWSEELERKAKLLVGKHQAPGILNF